VYIDDVVISGCNTISAKAITQQVITAEAEKGRIEIFPNPADNILYIKGISIDFRSRQFSEIYDVSGRKIKSNIIAGNSLNVSSLKPGVYFIRIIQNNASIFSGRFLKK